ncbi:hypothetical protein BofuT4_P153410.1 [Botrytis cinerea T4]|nr:hypothetical protein BofuT4_P153410.1 [Botrytis cinerea T4]
MPSEIVRFLKCLFGVQVGYPIAIAAIKFSILFFYRRIFSIGPTKLPLVLLGAVVAAWAIAMIIMGIFSCRPVRGFWMREEIPTVCMSEVTYLLAVAIPNVVTDIVLIIFPLPILWSLKVTMSHRIALSGIFLIGGFIVIISCLRLITVTQSNSNPDVTWALLPLGIFNVLEMNIGILCACLPSMAPLLRILMGKAAMTSNPTPPAPSGHSISTSGRKPWSSSKRSNTHGLSVLESQNESVTWLNDAPTTHTGVVMRPKTSIHGPEPSQIELHQMKDDGKIRVDRNITWSES